MRTRERNEINVEVLSLKQASMSRALLAAREAMSSGLLRTRSRSATIPYTRELRVKSA